MIVQCPTCKGEIATHKPDELYAALSSQEEITVESALKELREMFPLKTNKYEYSRKHGHPRPISIDCTDHVYSDENGDARRQSVKISISYAQGGFSAPLIVQCVTLSDAMAQVRAWHKEQK